MPTLILQNLLDVVLSKKLLILVLKPALSQVEITPYTFFISTRPAIFNKAFYNFFYFLHLGIFLLKLFLNKFFIKYFVTFEKTSYMINLFILKLYNPSSQLRSFLFKRYFSNIIIRI